MLTEWTDEEAVAAAAIYARVHRLGPEWAWWVLTYAPVCIVRSAVRPAVVRWMVAEAVAGREC